MAALTAGEFDLYLGEVKLTGDFDLTALIAPAGALNYGKYSDADAQTLLAAFRAAGEDGRSAAGLRPVRPPGGDGAHYPPSALKTGRCSPTGAA